MASIAALNATAKSFKALHQPGNPLVLTNVWSIPSANAIASLSQTKALASASFAVARQIGLKDDDLSFDQNIAGVRELVKIAASKNLPFTTDYQDGYGERLEEGIKQLIALGVVGVNLEDYIAEKQEFYSIAEAASRVERVLRIAADLGVPDFVVNARTDVLVHGGSVDDAIAYGKAFLDAGATTVFVWGGGARGVRDEEVAQLVKAFDGRLAVIVKKDGLTVKQLRELGIARASIGPRLMLFAEEAIKQEAARIIES
jgi:2-methylisocitrate lyase-like PEP mutase family enzyme